MTITISVPKNVSITITIKQRSFQRIKRVNEQSIHRFLDGNPENVPANRPKRETCSIRSNFVIFNMSAMLDCQHQCTGVRKKYEQVVFCPRQVLYVMRHAGLLLVVNTKVPVALPVVSSWLLYEGTTVSVLVLFMMSASHSFF
jgi:hypothetical protein